MILTLTFASVNTAAAEPPTFDEVTQTIAGYFESLPDYQPRDLVSQRDVAGVLTALEDLGWNVPYADKIVGAALADTSFLVTELATPNGKKFMRKIAVNPGAYSRLERLSQINKGKDAVKILIRDPGGDKMITYMATTPGGRNLGKKLAQTPDGTNLNKHTGRIYTADDLLAVVRMAYARSFTKR